jgi:hypothetical protein
MTNQRVAPAAETAQLTEQLPVLMTEDMRAFLLGSKIADGARSEGAVARALLEESILAFWNANGPEYNRRMKLGRAELKRRRDASA